MAAGKGELGALLLRSRSKWAVISTGAQAGLRAERNGETSHFSAPGEGGAERLEFRVYAVRTA